VNLGTGVFCSALVLATVYLYVHTRGRWNWRKIVLIPVALVATAGVAGGAYLWYLDYRNANFGKDDSVVYVFGEFEIGASPADVRFLKGEPTVVRADPNRWEYRDADGSAWVLTFEAGKLYSVELFSDRRSSATLSEIGFGMSAATLIQRYGRPDWDFRSVKETDRMYCYDKLASCYGLRLATVEYMSMYDRSSGPPRAPKGWTAAAVADR
jgi:hypothetical protein